MDKYRNPKLVFTTTLGGLQNMNIPHAQNEPLVVSRRHNEVRGLLIRIRRMLIVGFLILAGALLANSYFGTYRHHLDPRAHTVTGKDWDAEINHARTVQERFEWLKEKHSKALTEGKDSPGRGTNPSGDTDTAKN